MAYIEGFVAAVPSGNEEAYRKHAAAAAPIFKEFGALRVVECWGDDVPEGKVTDFQRAVKAKEDEVIIFSWIEYPSKDVRDAANVKVMSDPRMNDMGDMPFDGKRMIFGGFAVILEEGPGSGMSYVDGALLPVPAGSKAEYQEFAARNAAVLRDCGATRVVDAWSDDIPDGEITDFKGAVLAEGDEGVIYSWVEWPSRAARDEGWGKAMADPRMAAQSMPFDGQRMVHGGFRSILDL